MIAYNKLTTTEKATITSVLNIKHKIADLQADYDQKSEKAFQIVKASDGVSKGKDSISYVAQGKAKMVFNEKAFALEYPQLYAQFLESQDGAKEHIRFNLAK